MCITFTMTTIKHLGLYCAVPRKSFLRFSSRVNQLKLSRPAPLDMFCKCGKATSSQNLSTTPPTSRMSVITSPFQSHHNPKDTCMRWMSSKKADSAPSSRIFPLWQRLLIVSGVGGILYYMFKDALYKKEIEGEETRYKELGKAQLGGDWTLTDHHGNTRSSKDFRGKWILLYFGFTHCPDICPEELEKLALIVKTFDEDPAMPNIQPVFISLDPERDSPAVIKEYCAEFYPTLIGFTGPEEVIREVCKKFRVYFGMGERDENNDYIVDHTIIIYLINPRGEFVNYFGRSLNAEAVSKSVAQHIHRYRELEAQGKLK